MGTGRVRDEDVEISTVPRDLYPHEFAAKDFAVAVLDLELRFVDANEAFEQTLGIHHREIHRTALSDLWSTDQPLDVRVLMQRLEVSGMVSLAARSSHRRPATPGAVLGLRSIVDHDGVPIGFALSPTCAEDQRERRRRSLEAEGLELSFDQIAVGMLLTGMDGYAIKCNPAMKRLLRRSAEEIATTEALAMIWADDRDRIIEQATRLVSGEIESYSQEVRLLTGDGCPVWVHETATCVRDRDGRPLHFLSQFVDIDARKRAEAELLETQVMNRFLFDGTPIPLLHLGPSFEICTANRALVDLLGRDPIGLAIADVVHPDDMALLIGEGAAVSSDQDWVTEFRVRNAAGDDRLVRSHGRIHFDDEGEFRSAIAAWTDITVDRDETERLRHLASTDPLTDLPHRAAFLDRLSRAIVGMSGPGSVAVLYIDLDHFKPVNDRLGHAAGDELLRQVADRLRTCVRSTDMVARLGGDEFAVLLDASVPGADPATIGERIVERLARPVETTFGEVAITASVGLAFATPESGADAVVHRADLAAYEAKAGGRNRLWVATAARAQRE